MDLGAGTHAQRVFGEVVHVQVHQNGFVSGTARMGRTNIAFDSYSFQQARDGLHLGPFFLRKYEPAAAVAGGQTLRKRGMFSGGRARGTMVYGTVIQPTAGKHRFLDAVVADELHFFWSTLQYGHDFVHANWKRYFAGGTDKACGELFAAACLLVGDAHTLARASARSPQHSARRSAEHMGRHSDMPAVHLRQDAVSFVLLVSLLCQSAEPFRLFAQVARLYADPAVLQRLRFPSPCTQEVADAFVAPDCTVDASAVPPGTVFHDLEPGHVRQAALAIARMGTGSAAAGDGRRAQGQRRNVVGGPRGQDGAAGTSTAGVGCGGLEAGVRDGAGPARSTDVTWNSGTARFRARDGDDEDCNDEDYDRDGDGDDAESMGSLSEEDDDAPEPAAAGRHLRPVLF